MPRRTNNQHPSYDLALLGQSDRAIIVGCDPGPECCAFVTLAYDGRVSCLGAKYVSNLEIENTRYGVGMTPAGEIQPDVFAYERVGFQGRLAGKSVFDTATIAGVLRRIFFIDADVRRVVSFSPSDWRYVLVGRGNARDSETRACLSDLSIAGLDDRLCEAAKEARASLGLSKSCLPHLRDAAGVAFSVIRADHRLGDGSLIERVVLCHR